MRLINNKDEAIAYIKEIREAIVTNSSKIIELRRVSNDLENEIERFQNKFNISDEEIE